MYFHGMITNINQLDLNGSYNYADYLTWQFEEYVELIRGRIYRMPPAPSRKHQRVASNLHLIIAPAFRGNPCDVYFAPFDVRLLDRKKSAKSNRDILTVVQPDICVICDRSKLDDAGCLGAPDWIIEILSAGSQRKDRKDKLQLYEENGVREYWIVSPFDDDVAVYLLDDQGQYRLTGLYSDDDEVPCGILPGLSIPVPKIFAE